MILEQVDEIPFSGSFVWEIDPSKQEASTSQDEITRSLGIVDETSGHEGRRSETEGVPQFWTCENERGPVKESSHQFLVGRWNKTKSITPSRSVEPVAEWRQLPRA